MNKYKLYKAQNGKTLSETSDVVQRGKFTLPDRVGTQIQVGPRELPQGSSSGNVQVNPNQTYYNDTYRQMSAQPRQDRDDIFNGFMSGAGKGLKKIGNKLSNWIGDQRDKFQERQVTRDAPYGNELSRINDGLTELQQLRKELRSGKKRDRLDARGRNVDERVNRAANRLENFEKRSSIRDKNRDLESQSDMNLTDMRQEQRGLNQVGRANRYTQRQTTSNMDAEQEAADNLLLAKMRQNNKNVFSNKYQHNRRILDATGNDERLYNMIDRENDNQGNRTGRLNRLKRKSRNEADRVYEGYQTTTDENGNIIYDYNIAPDQGMFGKPNEPLNRLQYDKYRVYQDGGYMDDDFDSVEDVDTYDLYMYMNGGNLPKAQVGLEPTPPTPPTFTEDELKKKGWLTPKGISRTPNMVESTGAAWGNSDGEIIDFEHQYDNTINPNDQQITPVATESNSVNTPYWLNNPETSKYMGDINAPQVNHNNPTQKVDDYDPWRIYEPGNITQQMSEFGPLLYNVGKYLEPTAERKVFHTPPSLRRDAVNPDYTAINESRNAIMDTLRSNSRSPQGFLANAVNANMQIAKQKNQIANEASRANLQLEQTREAKVNADRQLLDNKKQISDNLRLQDEATREDFGRQAVEVAEKIGKHKGQFLNQEKSDRIRMETYLNQLSKDYQYKQLPNGMWEVKHTGGGSSYMSNEEMQKHFDAEKKKTQDLVDSETARRKAALEANKPKEEVKEESKKFGGWLKESTKPLKHRNRLYL